jgi:hypothetical protein
VALDAPCPLWLSSWMCLLIERTDIGYCCERIMV